MALFASAEIKMLNEKMSKFEFVLKLWKILADFPCSNRNQNKFKKVNILIKPNACEWNLMESETPA